VVSCLQELAPWSSRLWWSSNWSGHGSFCVVVVVLFVGSAFLSFTVVQAHSDKRAAAARHGMVRCFMDMDGRWRCDFAVRDCVIDWSIIWGVTLIVEGPGNESTG